MFTCMSTIAGLVIGNDLFHYVLIYDVGVDMLQHKFPAWYIRHSFDRISFKEVATYLVEDLSGRQHISCGSFH